MRPKLVAPIDKIAREFFEIVYFAVVDDDDRMIFVKQRLSATGNIDYGKSSMTQTNSTVDKDTITIRSPVILKVVHTGKQSRINVMRHPAIEYSNYSTHVDPKY